MLYQNQIINFIRYLHCKEWSVLTAEPKLSPDSTPFHAHHLVCIAHKERIEHTSEFCHTLSVLMVWCAHFNTFALPILLLWV